MRRRGPCCRREIGRPDLRGFKAHIPKYYYPGGEERAGADDRYQEFRAGVAE